MFTPTSDQWHWSLDLDEGVNFCVWVLLWDGLHVPPFDRHTGGNGILRARGMNANDWIVWLNALLGLQVRVQENTILQLAEERGLFLRAVDAPGRWPGEPAVGEQLALLWKPYGKHWNEWKRSKGRDHVFALMHDPDISTMLYDSLRAFRTQLPTLQAFITEYPFPVYYTAQPNSIILGTNDGTPDSAAYAETILLAAKSLIAK